MTGRYLVRIVSYAWDPGTKGTRQSPLYAVSISEAQLEAVMAALHDIGPRNRHKAKGRTANAAGVRPRARMP